MMQINSLFWVFLNSLHDDDLISTVRFTGSKEREENSADDHVLSTVQKLKIQKPNFKNS
jgi:hypothetical protein